MEQKKDLKASTMEAGGSLKEKFNGAVPELPEDVGMAVNVPYALLELVGESAKFLGLVKAYGQTKRVQNVSVYGTEFDIAKNIEEKTRDVIMEIQDAVSDSVLNSIWIAAESYKNTLVNSGALEKGTGKGGGHGND